MKFLVLFCLSLLLFSTTHSASYKDNQTDIYVTPYSGDLIKDGNVTFQAGRIVIGVKEGVTKDQVIELVKPYEGEISGWAIVPGLYDSYSIDLQPDKREGTIARLKSDQNLIYVIRNDIEQSSEKIFTPGGGSYASKYLGDIIVDTTSPSNHLDANTFIIAFRDGIGEDEVNKLISPYGGNIMAWIRSSNGYKVFLPADQRELAIIELATKSSVRFTERNYYYTIESGNNPTNSSEQEQPIYVIKKMLDELITKGLLVVLVSIILFLIWKKFSKIRMH